MGFNCIPTNTILYIVVVKYPDFQDTVKYYITAHDVCC